MTGSHEPRRGDVWLVGFGAARAGEPGKWRPAVVVSVDELAGGGRFDLFVVVPLTASLAPSEIRPSVRAGEGVERDSVAICRAVRGMARSRLSERLGSVSADTLSGIERTLTVILGLDRG